MRPDIRGANATFLNRLRGGVSLVRAWSADGDHQVRGQVWTAEAGLIRLTADIDMNGTAPKSVHLDLVTDMLGVEPTEASLNGVLLPDATSQLIPTVDGLTIMVSWPDAQTASYIALSAPGNWGHWEVTV